MANVQGNRGLNFRGGFDVEEILEGQKKVTEGFVKLKKEAEKSIKPLKLVTNNDIKPLTEYQRELIRVKEEQLLFNKQKQEEARADKAAALATQAALKEEVRLRKEAKAAADAQAKASSKRPVDIGNTQQEIANYNASISAGGSSVAKSGLDQYIKLLNEDLQNGKINIKDYNAELARLNLTQQQASKSSKDLTLSKKELDKIALQEKLNSEQNNRALKNSVREMNAAKGSIEQRRAALIRLNSVYDNLNVAERNSASGQRLQGIVSRLNTQVKDLEASTGRAQRNVGNYGNSFSKAAGKAFGALRTVANILPGIGLAGLLAFAIEPIMKFIKGLDLFKSKVTEAKIAQENMAKALAGSEYTGAVKNVNELRINIDLAKQGLLSKESVLKQYNETIGKTTGEVKTLDQAEQDLAKNARAFIEMTLLKAAAQIALEDAAKKAYEAEITRRKRLEEFGSSFDNANFGSSGFGGTGAFNASEYEKNQKRIIKAQEDRRNKEAQISQEASDQQLNIAAKFQEDAAKKAKEFGFASILGNDDDLNKINKSNLNAAAKQLEAQRALQAEIDVLTQKGRAKQLRENEQDLLDIDLKYQKLTEKAIAFNKDPKNKIKVNLSGLGDAQQSERAVATDKNLANSVKKELADLKKLYDSFEKDKNDFGIAKAKERYKDLINVEETYLDQINRRLNAILPDDKAKGGNELGQYSVEQLKVLREARAEAQKIEQERTDSLLKQFMNYADKRKVLTEKYQSDIAVIEAAGEDPAERTKAYNAELKQLDDANSDKLESYEKLFLGIEKLSTRNALKAVTKARELLAKDIKGGILTPEQIKEINDLLNQTEIAIGERSGQALINLAGAINDVASAVGNIDDEFGKVLSTVGNIVNQVGSIKKGLNDFKIAQGANDSLGQLTAGLGIFGAGVGIFTSIFKMFDRSAQREEQAAYSRDLQNKQTEALNKALERQVALLDQVYGTERITNYSAAIEQARANEKKYAEQLTGRFSLTGNKRTDEFIEELNRTGTVKFIEAFSGTKAVDQFRRTLSELPKDIKALELLADEGKLDEGTRIILNNLIQARDTAQQLVNNLNADLTGTSLDKIADDFISTLTDGTKDFGKTFEETIQKSILNGFKGELIRNQLQAFYTEFAELSKGGLTSTEIEILRASYIAASEKAKADLEALSKATGIDLTGGQAAASPNAPTGIARAQLTEETGTRIDGILRSTYEVNKATNVLLQPVPKTLIAIQNASVSGLNELVAINNNTLRTANNTDQLNTKLDAIISNTKPAITPRGAGI